MAFSRVYRKLLSYGYSRDTSKRVRNAILSVMLDKDKLDLNSIAVNPHYVFFDLYAPDGSHMSWGVDY